MRNMLAFIAIRIAAFLEIVVFMIIVAVLLLLFCFYRYVGLIRIDNTGIGLLLVSLCF